MKYPAIFTTALTSLYLVTSSFSHASDNTKVPEEELARWFEIEVILFKHVTNSSQNKEVFSSRDLSRKKRNARDLLAPYLQPNIASLKQLLPSCEQEAKPIEYGVDLSKIDLPISATDTQEISEEASQTLEEGTVQQTQDSSMSVTVLTDEASLQNQNENLAEQSQQSQTDNESNQETASEVVYPYADKEIPSYTQYPTDRKKPICIIPTEVVSQNLSDEQLASFNIDGFPIEKLTTTVNGIEQWRDDEEGEITWASNQPYLISQDSLRLKSIANRIKRSRNYAPLLHLGWRQEGKKRRQAKATRLYAGDNLALNYQQALIKQQAKQNELEIAAILEQRLAAQVLIQEQLAMSETALTNSQFSDENTSQAFSGSGELQTSNQTSNEALGLENQGQESLIQEPLTQEPELTITEQLQLQAKQKQLDNLFAEFAQFNQLEAKQGLIDAENSLNSTEGSHTLALNDEAVKDIVSKLSADLNRDDNLLLLADNEDEESATAAPTQPWFLDGIFKVHLDHYLYINSEFNLVSANTSTKSINSSKAKSDTNSKLEQGEQVISFRQDRRVITGEIHYFDHPRMGMVVQIRRFDPTKPADEAVSQSKK